MSESKAAPRPSATSNANRIPNIRGQMLRAFLKGLIMPALVLVLFLAAPSWLNKKVRTRVMQEINSNMRLPQEQKNERLAFFSQVDFQKVCLEAPPEFAALRANLVKTGICGNFERLRWALFLSWGLLGLLVTASGVMLLLNQAGRRSRDDFMRCYRLSWKIGMLAALAKLLILTPLLAYGSFELTVLLGDRYYPQLLLVIVLGGLATLWRGAAILLKDVPMEFNEPISREVSPAEAPALWQAVRQAAERVQTTPPDHIIIGVQLNFYVTELAVKHGTGRTQGRTLYLSYPMLKQLTAEEVYAIIGHELGHFLGEDTRMTREFYPLRLKVRATMMALTQANYLGWTSLQLLNFFCWCFGETEQAESRKRELLADQQAAALTSPETAARALVKFHVLVEAFNHGLAAAVHQEGQNPLELPLHAYIREKLPPDAAFWAQLFQKKLPHPLDSHPVLQVRLAALGRQLSVTEAQTVATQEVPTAYAEWFSQREDLFANIRAEASEILGRMQSKARVIDADYQTEAGKALLDRLFPEKRWQVKQGGLWFILAFLGILSATCLWTAAVIKDPTAWLALGSVVLLFVLAGVGSWIRHRHGEFLLDATGVTYTGWKRPLRFAEVRSVSAQRNSSRVTLIFHLKEAQPPLWKFSALRMRRKRLGFSLTGLNAKPISIAQTVFRYFTRQEENPAPGTPPRRPA